MFHCACVLEARLNNIITEQYDNNMLVGQCRGQGGYEDRSTLVTALEDTSCHNIIFLYIIICYLTVCQCFQSLINTIVIT